MANYFLNSWMPQLFNNAGLTPKKAALASSLYHIGGTVGGLLISVLLDRFGFIVIAALFVCAAPAIAAIGGSSMSYAVARAAGGHRRVFGAGRAVRQQRGGRVAVSDALPLQGSGLGTGYRTLRRHIGPIVGGYLIKMHLPMRQLFLAASAPMWIGAVAALILVRLCYMRLGRLQLSDVPVRR